MSPTDRIADSPAADRELTVSRMIDAPRAMVFQAWTDPKQIARWWGPKGFTTVDYDIDVRPGGAYRLRMRSPEGHRSSEARRLSGDRRARTDRVHVRVGAA